MTPDGLPEPRHVERAVDLLRAHLVERAASDASSDDHVNDLARAIVTCLRQTTEAPVERARGRDLRLPREYLHRAIKFINANLDAKLDWAQIADAVGLAPFHFGRSFKITTGLTPHQYVIRCRIRRAMRLLMTPDRSIADISLEVGCSCQSHLTTLFKKHTGTTPGAFREAAMRGTRTTPHRFNPAVAIA